MTRFLPKVSGYVNGRFTSKDPNSLFLSITPQKFHGVLIYQELPLCVVSVDGGFILVEPYRGCKIEGKTPFKTVDEAVRFLESKPTLPSALKKYDEKYFNNQITIIELAINSYASTRLLQ